VRRPGWWPPAAGRELEIESIDVEDQHLADP